MATIWGGSSAHADDIAANKAALLTGLLPTVVDISIRRVMVASPSGAGQVAVTFADANQDIKTAFGSGFVVDPSGLIVTNYHVVENAFEITVTFSDGTRLLGKTLSATRTADLALVKVEPDHPLAAVHWGDSDRMRVGDQVFAMGDPFGIGLSASAGIVSALNRDIQNSPYDDFIQTDATINHGNSGGPLFNTQGEVIGVNSALLSPTRASTGLGFSLPSNSARFVIERLQAYGWIRPAWIGIRVQQVTPEIADAMRIPNSQGSIISWVMPDSPAEKAGIAIGDLIRRFDGQTPSDDRALLRDIAHSPVGETVTLLVTHNGIDRSVSVVTQEWPRNQWDAQYAPAAIEKLKLIVPPDLGLSLSVLDATHKARYGLDSSANGVLVTKVEPGTDPASRGVASGDIVMRVQDKAVSTPAEVQAGIDAARAEKRNFVLMLVLPKVHDVPEPKWIPLALGALD